jgi:hypothetical protein
MTRIYVPATAATLARWHADGQIPAAALAEGFEAPDDTEEGEYAALMSAADASAAMLAGPGRRFVVVVDTDDAPVDWVDVAAIHADATDRPADADPDEDLAWFGTQEISDVLG